MAETLRGRGERSLLEEIRRLCPARGRVRRGPGDDAAIVAPSPHPLLLTTDALVEGVHFRRGWLSPRALGRRAFEVSASDVAAMGGAPVAVLLALTAPPATRAAEIRGLVAGVRDAADAAGAVLAGGNVSGARVLSVTVTVLGEARHPAIGRDGAQPGDQLFVTGALGEAALGLRALARGGGGSPVARRWGAPRARLRAGQTLARRAIASAMIDLSDGLLIDAERLCQASGVGARLRAPDLPLGAALRALPPAAARRLALTGGEDYELLFAVRPARLAALARARATLGCAVHRVGEIVRGSRGRVVVLDAQDRPMTLPVRRGHEHFTRP